MSRRSVRAAVAAAVVVVAAASGAETVVTAETAAAEVVVAADKDMMGGLHPQQPQPAMSSQAQPSTEPQQPAQFAEGTQPSPRISSPDLAEGTSPEAPAFRAPPELVTRAGQLGEVWSHEYVRELRAQNRDIVGGWPGTLREARRRVLAAMPRNLDPLLLDELARITNLAARRCWEQVSEPDLEP